MAKNNTGQLPAITRAMRRSVIDSANYICKLCGKKTDDGDVEFVKPLSKGGQPRLFNMRWVCSSCCNNRQAPVETIVKKTSKPKKTDKPKKTGGKYSYAQEHRKFIKKNKGS